MKAKTLARRLNNLIEEHGNLEVDLHQDEAEESGELSNIALFKDTKDQITRFTLVGKETALAFS